MRVVVCIKEVPDTTEVKIDPETNTLIRQGVPSILNPFDMYALETALQLKDKYPDVQVSVLSMGPPQAEKNLRDTIAMGADEVFLITDKAFAGADTHATSYTLSTAIKHIGGADIIFAGKQAIDGDTAQTGPGIAEWLDLPQIAFVKKIHNIGDGKLTAERSTEIGYEIVEAQMPVVITIVKIESDPRLPSLRGMMKAKKSEIKKLTAKDLPVDEKKIGLSGSPTQVHKIFNPQRRAGGQILEGETQDMVKKVLTELEKLQLV